MRVSLRALSLLLSRGQSVEDRQRARCQQNAQHDLRHAKRNAALLKSPVDVGGHDERIGRRDQAGRDQFTEGDDSALPKNA